MNESGTPRRPMSPTSERGGATGPDPPTQGSPLEVLAVTTRLGLTSFGGPVAHLRYFHDMYVVRRRWLDEDTYSDLVSLCQFLPGPVSSELGIAIGMTRAGLLGGLMAWIGFTLPSAIALVAFAYLVHGIGASGTGWLHGLQLVTVAVVAQAVWQMGRRLTPDRERIVIALLVAIAVLAWPSSITQVAAIAIAGIAGWKLLPGSATPEAVSVDPPVSRRVGVCAWMIFLALLLGLPVLLRIAPSQPLALATGFFRAGSLVFGGGHVVLPLLQTTVVSPGWLSRQQFLTGYGAAQAVPGPLFTVSAYLGEAVGPKPNGIAGASIALVAIFLPAFLLVTGTLPFWGALRARPGIRSALSGVNAAVVGLLLAALYNPVWTTTIKSATDFVVALAAFGLLMWWKLPPWSVVLIAVAMTALIKVFSL